MKDLLNLRPSQIESCLIEKETLNNIFACNFVDSRILLRGRAGSGKTIICKLLKEKYPSLSIIEDVKTFLDIPSPCLCTTTNLSLYNAIFDKIIDIIPLSRILLLKKLTELLSAHGINSPGLYESILLFYPNINKILTHYLNDH